MESRLQKVVLENDLTSFGNILDSDEVKKEGNLRRKEWRLGEAPLQSAAFYGKDGIVRLLVRGGFDVNSFVVYKEENRCTALHWAVWNNKASTVKLVLDLGGDMDVSGKWDKTEGTALDFAKHKGFAEVAKILEEHKEQPPPQPKPPPPKRPKEAELSEALHIRDQIDEKLLKAVKIDLTIKSLYDHKRILSAELCSLRELSGFRNKKQIQELTVQVEEKELLVTSSCPICFEAPKQVFNCVECENWVCNFCKGKLEICPSCRESFSDSPPRRNRTVERLLGI